jgi:signal peptidase II
LFWLAAAVLLLDQITKEAIIQTMPLNTWHAPIPALYPFFRFTHIANTGGVFGFMQGGSPLFAFLALLMIVGMVWYNQAWPMRSRKLRLALGLVLGGAVGNLIDRLRLGYVTDFLDFDVSSRINLPLANWPVFNVADMAIVAGIIVMSWLTLFRPHEIEPPEQPAPSSEETDTP